MGRFHNIKQLDNKIIKYIIKLFLANQELLKYVSITDSKPLSYPDIANSMELLKTHIFKKTKMIKAETSAQSFITMSLINVRNKDMIIREKQLIINVICHDNLVDNLSNGDDRIYCILDIIDDILMNAKPDGKWLSKIMYQGDSEIYVNENFTGRRVVYTINTMA